MYRLISIIAFGAALSGCSGFGGSEAHVASTTSWSGSFDGRTIDGKGDQTISLGGGIQCVVVQKQTRTGSLSVDVNGSNKRTTTAEFGVVSACSSGSYSGAGVEP